MLSYYLYIYIFTDNSYYGEDAERMYDLGKVRKGYGVSSQSRCLETSVGLMAATPYPRRLFS